jgi:hypothetical protein
MRKFLLSTAAAALLAASGAASADVQKLGTISTVIPESFNSIVEKGDFVDFFKFTLASDISHAGFSIIDLQVPGLFNVRFDSFALFSNADGKIGNGDDIRLAFNDTTSGKGLSFDFGPTIAGKYYLMVSGQGLGALGGLYNGSISVAAVPEPESFAMMLAGLGLMGTIARRRNKANS